MSDIIFSSGLIAILVVGALALLSTAAAFGFELRHKGFRDAVASLTMFVATLVGFTVLIVIVIVR